MQVYVNMLHKHIFGFHKSEFVKCKLLANLEEKFIAGKNRMNSKKVISEAAVSRCSSKEVLLKISQYSQENTCVGVSFLIKLQAL